MRLSVPPHPHFGRSRGATTLSPALPPERVSAVPVEQSARTLFRHQIFGLDGMVNVRSKRGSSRPHHKVACYETAP